MNAFNLHNIFTAYKILTWRPVQAAITTQLDTIQINIITKYSIYHPLFWIAIAQ